MLKFAVSLLIPVLEEVRRERNSISFYPGNDEEFKKSLMVLEKNAQV